MTDLVDFLRARLAEDEQVATEARRWSAEWAEAGTWHLEGVEHNVIGDEEAFCHPRNVNHIARHDPVRVLREVEAKRRLLDRQPCDDCGMGDDPCETLLSLALPYSDHPDYDESRRP